MLITSFRKNFVNKQKYLVYFYLYLLSHVSVVSAVSTASAVFCDSVVSCVSHIKSFNFKTENWEKCRKISVRIFLRLLQFWNCIFSSLWMFRPDKYEYFFYGHMWCGFAVYPYIAIYVHYTVHSKQSIESQVPLN